MRYIKTQGECYQVKSIQSKNSVQCALQVILQNLDNCENVVISATSQNKISDGCVLWSPTFSTSTGNAGDRVSEG